VVGSGTYGDESAGSGATELVNISEAIKAFGIILHTVCVEHNAKSKIFCAIVILYVFLD
jgi:hypothetical protein